MRPPLSGPGSSTSSSRRASSRCPASRWAPTEATFRTSCTERWEIVPQGISAEVIAEEWGLSREELDAYSLQSHRRAVAAIDEGRFEREIVPVEVTNPHVGTLVGIDETPRRDTSLEALAGLAPAFIPEGRSHRGELEPNLRRRRRRADRERARVRAARAGAARTVPVVRARGRRPASDAARQPAGLRQRAREGGAQLGRHRA